MSPAQPNDYNLTFVWPKNLGILRILDLKKGTVLLTEKSQNTLVFNHVLGGEQQSYSIELLDSFGKTKSILQKEVLIPLDKVISNLCMDQDLSIEADRVFILPSSVLVTNGFHLKIKSKEFYSQSLSKETPVTQIKTFDLSQCSLPSSVPMEEKIGTRIRARSGGIIEVQSEIATGELQVFLIGLDGKPGQNGLPYTEPAANGRNGENGVCNPDYYGCTCSRQATKGERGEIGRQGRAGTDGQDGGSTGKFSAWFEDSKNLHIEFVFKAGYGGAKGLGGPGQKGGDPGKPGEFPGQCNNPGRWEKEFNDGAPGVNGSNGINGTKEDACVETPLSIEVLKKEDRKLPKKLGRNLLIKKFLLEKNFGGRKCQ